MTTDIFGVDLPMTNMDVARMTGSQRRLRLAALLIESQAILDRAIDEHVTGQGKQLAGVVALFSGGNDSTTLAHMFKEQITHAAHANTTVGIEQTRDFVRNTCAEWGVPLIERKPPRESDHYRALVLSQGFPGPGHHFKMYQRLKERALRQVRGEIVTRHTERVVFIAGRRRDESQRRVNVPESERDGSIVWVSPLVHWTKLDLNTYRLANADVPRNEVSDLIHMSGECLCGAFAAPGEREEISQWFPLAFEQMDELEALIAGRADIPAHRKTWGWGGNPAIKRPSEPRSEAGRLCSSCDVRFEQMELGATA